MTKHWEEIEDGYHRRMRYVRYPEGLVIGHVSGTNYDHGAWAASIEVKGRGELIGNYTTEGLAKKAVEDYFAASDRSGE